MQLTLRLRKSDERLPVEHVLDPEYTLDEVQEEVNLAIDHGHEVKLMLASGDILEFDPKDYEVISASYPTDAKERR